MESQNYISEQLQTFGLLLSKSIEFYMLDFSIRSGLFDLLEKDFLTTEEIKEKLQIKCNTRNFQDFLDKLYVNKHLLREGNVDSPKYRTAQDAYLKSNPNNIRALVLFYATSCTKKTSELENYFYGKVKFDTFEDLYAKEENTYNFLKSMVIFQHVNFAIIPTKFDFSKFKTLTDIGGGLGTFALSVKKTNPGLECTTFDLPKIEPLVKHYLADNKMEDKVKTVYGDMFVDEFPKSDIISMGNILHDWGTEKKRYLFKKTYDALNENGVFMIIEEFIDNERKEKSIGLDSSCWMLIATNEGYNTSVKDIEALASEAGFRSVESFTEKIDANLVVCYK
jgi:hypothetical protein